MCHKHRKIINFCREGITGVISGQSNKLINISTSKASLREEFVTDVQPIAPNEVLTVHAGKRHFTLKAADLRTLSGERGRRGNRLPRGLQNVTALEVTSAEI